MYDLMLETGRSNAITGMVNELIETGLPIQGLHVGVDELFAQWYYTALYKEWRWSVLPEYWPWRSIRYFEEIPAEVRREIPRWWSGHAQRVGYGDGASPFYIKVLLREEEYHLLEFERPRAIPNRNGRYRIIYEPRPPAVARAGLTLWHGDGIRDSGGMSFGTCGGGLQDAAHGTKYGVTCRHVLSQQGGRVETSLGGQPIGHVQAMGSLSPTPAGSFCNHRAVPGASSTDWSVFEIDTAVSVQVHQTQHGRIAHERSTLNIGPYIDVEFTGATSGRRECQTGSVGVWHEVIVDGTPHCFGDIFQLKWRPGTRFTCRRTNKDLIQSGDSGAWVISDAPSGQIGADVFGMVIAGDGADGYASFAENFLGEIRNTLGSQTIGLMV